MSAFICFIFEPKNFFFFFPIASQPTSLHWLLCSMDDANPGIIYILFSKKKGSSVNPPPPALRPSA